MARYIDADKLTDKLEEIQFNAPVMVPVMKIYNVIELVEDTPTADVVEVKHGEWIKSIHKEAPIIKDGRLFEKEHEVFCCSVCDVKIVGLRNMSFCPFCGAKMDGERK